MRTSRSRLSLINRSLSLERSCRVLLCHGDSLLFSLAGLADHELRETRDQVWLLHNLAQPTTCPWESLWDAPASSFLFSLYLLEVRDAGGEGIFPSCLASAQESAGEKQEAFLSTGPQHRVSKLVILRKGQLNQPPARNVLGIFRSFSSLQLLTSAGGTQSLCPSNPSPAQSNSSLAQPRLAQLQPSPASAQPQPSPAQSSPSPAQFSLVQP